MINDLKRLEILQKLKELTKTTDKIKTEVKFMEITRGEFQV